MITFNNICVAQIVTLQRTLSPTPKKQKQLSFALERWDTTKITLGIEREDLTLTLKRDILALHRCFSTFPPFIQRQH